MIIQKLLSLNNKQQVNTKLIWKVKTKPELLKQVIETLIKKAFPFAVYRHPETKEICLIAQMEQIHLVHDIKEVCHLNGFLIAPFASVKTGAGYFIRNELFACDTEGLDDILKKIRKAVSIVDLREYLPVHEITKNDYLELTELVIEKLQKKELDKVVISRVISMERKDDVVVSDLFLKLAEEYQNAFVYLFFIPDSGMWIGATPETLLRQKENGDVVIMSLAGTVKPEKGKEVVWGEKEKVEQGYVSEYIRLRLTELGIKQFQEGEVKTIVAGPVAHLQTIFKVKGEQIAGKIGQLIKGLHPTPAVCGLPKVDAYNIIERLEKHDRRFYTGYLGPWKLNGKSDLFVNLRCAEITPDNINLYVGGGLTAGSDPEKEWEETELKAQTLLKVMS